MDDSIYLFDRIGNRLVKINIAISVPIVLLCCALASAGDHPDSGATKPRVLLTVGKNQYTVKGMSGVSYERGLTNCKKAFTRWQTNGSVNNWYYFPMVFPTNYYEDSPEIRKLNQRERQERDSVTFTSGSRIYNSALMGLIRTALVDEVQGRLIARYHVKLDKYVIPGALRKRARKRAKDAWRAQRTGDGILLKGWRESEYARQAARVYRRTFSKETYETTYKWVVSAKAIHYCAYHAFPRAIGPGKPAPWMLMRDRNSYTQVVIGDIIARNRAQFAHLTAKHFGKWQYLKITNAPNTPGSKVVLNRVVAALNAPNVLSRTLAIWSIDRTLRTLGSKTRVALREVNGGMIGEDGEATVNFGIGEDQFSVEKLLIANKSRRQPGLMPLYIYVYPRSDKYWKRYTKGSFGPESAPFLYTYAAEHVLTPIVKTVLKKAEPMAGLKLPTASALLSTMCGGQEYLPRIYKRMPWPVAEKYKKRWEKHSKSSKY